MKKASFFDAKSFSVGRTVNTNDFDMLKNLRIAVKQAHEKES